MKTDRILTEKERQQWSYELTHITSNDSLTSAYMIHRKYGQYKTAEWVNQMRKECPLPNDLTDEELDEAFETWFKGDAP